MGLFKNHKFKEAILKIKSKVDARADMLDDMQHRLQARHGGAENYRDLYEYQCEIYNSVNWLLLQTSGGNKGKASCYTWLFCEMGGAPIESVWRFAIDFFVRVGKDPMLPWSPFLQLWEKQKFDNKFEWINRRDPNSLFNEATNAKIDFGGWKDTMLLDMSAGFAERCRRGLSSVHPSHDFANQGTSLLTDDRLAAEVDRARLERALWAARIFFKRASSCLEYGERAIMMNDQLAFKALLLVLNLVTIIGQYVYSNYL